MSQRHLTASAALLAFSCILHPSSAKADPFTFTFTATGPGATATATLTGVADPTVQGAFDLTGGSGTFNGAPITLYTPSGTASTFQTANFTSPPFSFNSTYLYDNVVYTSGNHGLALDQYGLLFSEPNDHFNPFSVGPGYAYSNDETLFGFNAPLNAVTITPAATTVTPEPASIALLGTGLLGVAGVLRRRVKA